MVTNYNSDTIKELIQAGKLQVSRDRINTDFAEKIIPVVECNPKLLRRINIIKSATATNAANATIVTHQASKDFYLTAVELSIIKDVTATSTISYINGVIDGESVVIAAVVGLSLTPQSETISITFPYPIKIDRGSTQQIVNGTNVGNVTARGFIYGYYDDLNNA